ncbi:MAG: tetraacyldisaccharide 4'-kinase [Archangium sp.]
MDHWYQPVGWQAVLLWPFAFVWSLIIRLWHLAFDLGLRKATRIDGVNVISVGNLVVGGSGKTPVVIHLANAAAAQGHVVAVLSRGYGRSSRSTAHFTAAQLPPVHEVGDEPRLIARRCPKATIWVGSDRVALARAAAQAGATLLILDDGFQHRQLARDVDLLVDAGEGNGLMLPAGPLREPKSGRSRATHTWGRDGRPGDLEARHVLTGVRDASGQLHPLSELQNKNVVLLLGVARPSRVIESVTAAGARVTATIAHRDHHLFTPAEVDTARAAAKDAILLTTEKDAERLPPNTAWTLVMDVEVTKGNLPLPRSGEGRGEGP